MAMVLESTKCVVLNATYEPITVVTSKRALLLFLEGKLSSLRNTLIWWCGHQDRHFLYH